MASRIAYFRVDASPEIGIGHVMRCLTLADQLRDEGWHCSFISSSETPQIATKLANSDYTIYPPEFLPAEIDLLVVDHYDLDRQYEQSARQWAKHILVIDDLANREHDCDILLDQTFGRNEQDYVPFVPRGTNILCGSKYALLRPEFAKHRDISLQRRSGLTAIKTILISLGGTNLNNISSQVLEAFEYIEASYDITLVLGSSSPFLDDVRNTIEHLTQNSQHQYRLELDVTDMAQLMADSDFAIGAGGTTSWERCCVGLPSAVIELADNQRTLSRNLCDANAIFPLGWHENTKPDVIGQALTKNLTDMALIKQFSRNAAKVCDGLGVQRVSKAIGHQAEANSINIRPAEFADSCRLLEWRNEASTRNASINSEIIDLKDHESWLRKSLNSSDRKLYICELSNIPIGTTRIDKIDDNRFELSWTLSTAYRGRGLGKLMVSKTIAQKRNVSMIARVKKDNHASISIAQSVGMKAVSEIDDILVYEIEAEVS